MRKTLLLGLALAAGAGEAATITVTAAGDAPGTCPSAGACTLRAAIAAAAASDTIDFAPALSGTIQLAETDLVLDKSLLIQGPGADRLRISAAPGQRVLRVNAGTVVIAGLTLADGSVVGADGTDAAAQSGGNGTQGIPADGGCLRVASNATLQLERVAVRDCSVRGGNGGDGGSGRTDGPASNGHGGPGGAGGYARGGAIHSSGTLVLLHSSIHNARVQSGNGGRGGDGNTPPIGTGGTGGTGGGGGLADGGAISVAVSQAFLMRNSTIAGTVVVGGSGGDGGNAGGPGTLGGGPRGVAGRGGNAAEILGGNILFQNGPQLIELEFATLGPAAITSGAAGAAGTGQTPVAGTVPAVRGESLLAGSASVRVRHSLIGGHTAVGDCGGAALLATGQNLDTDSSCAGFTHHAPAAEALHALETQGGRVALPPHPDGPATDAVVDCTDHDALAVTLDQFDRPRPRDNDADGTARCDLGALEATRIFAGGFE